MQYVSEQLPICPWLPHAMHCFAYDENHLIGPIAVRFSPCPYIDLCCQPYAKKYNEDVETIPNICMGA